MTALTPAEFYQANTDKEKEYVRIHVAYRVCANEYIIAGGYEEKAGKDGYQIGTRVLDESEFAAETASAENLEPPLPREDLSEEQLRKLTPVGKGRPYIYNAWGSLVSMQADQDGFLIDEDDSYQTYLSNFELTSHFNYTGKKFGSQKKESVVTFKNRTPVKGIILDKDTPFVSEDRNYTAPKGSFVYPDPKADGGYKVEIMNHPNAHLRLSAEWTSRRDYHESIAERQAKLKSRAPRIRIKQS